MADENQDGLGGTKEQSSMEEIFSGPLEQPEGNESQSAEQPQEAKAEAGQSSGESEDSELGNLYADLEKDIPEALKPHATNVKKKVQSYLTKKTQSFSEKLKALESNQISDDLRRDYTRLYGWYERIQQNPQEGLKELASQYGVSVQALLNASEAERPQKEELTPDKLVTVEDYAAFVRQETRKAAEEIRDKEVKPLKEAFNKIEGASVQKENIQRGAKAVEEAKSIPGFTDSEGKISKEANQAIASVLRGEFYGPNALKNAFKSIISESSSSKVKSLEDQLAALKANITGALPPPGGPAPKTITPPMVGSIEDRWENMRNEPLSL